MSVSNNSNAQQFRPSLPGVKVERSIAQIGKVLEETSSLTAKARDNDVDLFQSQNGNPEDQKAADLKHVKDIAKKNELKNQQLVAQANKSAAAILLKVGIGLDPELIDFIHKGTEGKSPEEAQKIIDQNIKAFINDKDNVKNVQIFASKLSEKLAGDKQLKADGKEGADDAETQELLAELESAMSSGSHEELQALLAKLQSTNPELLKSLDLKTEIKQYQKDLTAVFKSEQRNIANLEEIKSHPLYQDGVEFKNDKALRNLYAQLAGQIVDSKGGIYNYRDDQVTWALAPFEYKPGMDGKSVADISIRRLLPGEVAGNSRTYTAHLTEEQPTYETMQVA